MNLVKTILELLLSGEVLEKISSLLGTDEASTKKATSAAVPSILSGLAGMASSDDAAEKVASIFNGLDPGSLGNIGAMLGGDSNALTQKGGHLLSSLFGDSLLSNIASSIGKYSGMDTATTKKLLAMIGPPALGMIASQWKQEGGGLGALTNLLTSQQKNIAAALPSGFSLANIPGLPSAEGTLRVARESVDRTKEAAKDATSAAFNWLAPIAGLLLVALALWYFFGRNIPGPDAAQNAANAANKTANDAANRMTSLRPVLPDVPDIAAATKDVSGIFTSATQTLGNIRDAASAETALPKLNELNSKIDGIRNMLDKMPAASQVALGKLIGKDFAPLQERVAKITAMPGVSDQVKKVLEEITSKLAGMNLAQVSENTTEIFTNLTKTMNNITDAASTKDAVPQLREISGKIDDLSRVQASMSPGGRSMMAKLVASLRGPLETLITKVLGTLGADAKTVKPILDEIVGKLGQLETPSDA